MHREDSSPLIVNHILGHCDAAPFAGRPTERILVPAAEAGRRRMRVRTERGTDVAIDLPKQSWLFDGAVLHDDGRRVLVVARPPEPVMVIALADMAPAAVFRIGHALGNRHSPSELHGGEIVVPVTDTPELTARPVLALGLVGLVLRFENRPFAAAAPPTCGGAAHEHPPRQPEHNGHHEHHRPGHRD